LYTSTGQGALCVQWSLTLPSPRNEFIALRKKRCSEALSVAVCS